MALIELIALYASTGVGSGALSVRFAWSFANWFALVVVCPFVTVVTITVIGTRAHPVHANSFTDRLTGVHRVAEQSVALVTNATFRRSAIAILAGLAADRFAVAFCHLVSWVASADTRRRASAELATVLALWYTIEHVLGIWVVAVVASANIRFGAF